MLRYAGETRLRVAIRLDARGIQPALSGSLPTPVLGPLFFFVVDRNRIQIFGLKDLVAIEASNIIDPVPAIQKFGSLVLTSLHSEYDLF
jgi:hypothetical protein